VHDLAAKTLRYIDALRQAGFNGSVSLVKAAASNSILPFLGPEQLLRSKYADHPLICRRNTSDARVFYQVFARKQYSCFDDLVGVDLILDCGANVGYASAYLLSRHRQATVVAIEPDAGNFETLTRNLSPYGSRGRAIRAGVWPRRCGLIVSEAVRGAEWGVEVREARPDELPQLSAVDIESLMSDAGRSRISILKIDIEGSERALFSGECSWLDRVDNLAIEFHGADCEQIFMDAVRGRGFNLSRSTELTVCRLGHMIGDRV
jgi:FkbM family methyltransferase